MSEHIAAPSAAATTADTTAQPLQAVTWADPARQAQFAPWLQAMAAEHGDDWRLRTVEALVKPAAVNSAV